MSPYRRSDNQETLSDNFIWQIAYAIDMYRSMIKNAQVKFYIAQIRFCISLFRMRIKFAIGTISIFGMKKFFIGKIKPMTMVR